MSEMDEVGDTEEIPENYRAVAQLVAGFVDDKITEFRHEVSDKLEEVIAGIGGHLGAHQSNISALQATVGGLRDAVADLQVAAGESMPEHVYKQFIRAEAERLRIVKKVVRDDD